MHRLIDRNIEAFVNENLRAFPAVAILGPRQYGKFTLVKMLYKNSDAFLYLDHYIISSLRDCKFSFYRSAAGVTGIKKCSKNGNGSAAKMATIIQ